MESPTHAQTEAGGSGRKDTAPEGLWSSSRHKCPTCGARRREQPVCPRCGTGLSGLIAVEAHADRLYRRARGAYRSGLFRTAASRAAAAARLEVRPEFLRLLAVASLRSGDFAAAVRTARRVPRSEEPERSEMTRPRG